MAAIARVKAGGSVARVARSLNLKRQDLYRWMKLLDKLGPERAFSGRGYWQAKRTAALDRNGAGLPYFKDAESEEAQEHANRSSLAL